MSPESARELVLCVPARCHDWTGFVPSPRRIIRQLEAGTHSLRMRGDCEEDPTQLQLCTYAVVMRAGKVLTYRRAGSEGRLHGLRSVGVGGHVEFQDCFSGYFDTAIDRACDRELDEEIDNSSRSVLELIGFVRDDSNPVGRVHLGAVYLVDLADDAEPEFGDEIREPDWMNLYQVTWNQIAEMEPWSQFVLPWLHKNIDTI